MGRNTTRRSSRSGSLRTHRGFRPTSRRTTGTRKHGGVLGLEPLPEWFVGHLVEIFQRGAHALKPRGSMWVNIGDTYFARAATVAPRVDVADLQPVDMVVVGSVAVNRAGVRIGKGAGYSDLEFAFLMEAGLISDRTVVVSTVHSLQVLDEELPATDHDFGVDLIVTPDEVISCPSPHRPTGLVWEHLDSAKIASIPVLAARAPANGH